MNKGENIYYEIQKNGEKRVNETADKILRNLSPVLGYIQFPCDMSPINKIYALIENGFYPWMQKALAQYGYDYGAELQFLMLNMAYRENIVGVEPVKSFLSNFPSVNSAYYGNPTYQLETKLGRVMITPLTKFTQDSNIRTFAIQKNAYGVCHMAAQEFIMTNPSYMAITSLVSNQFGEYHYHSYVETEEGYADFANGVYLSQDDFKKIMRPKVLNTVCGHELEQQAAQLEQDDLPPDKALLLRLAVHNQISK